jgi:hypothetical protein
MYKSAVGYLEHIFPLFQFVRNQACFRDEGSQVAQYSETIVMHLLFSLLRIKGLYMFRALLAHPQEALHKRHLVYCVRVMSVGCTRVEVELQPHIIYQVPFV